MNLKYLLLLSFFFISNFLYHNKTNADTITNKQPEKIFYMSNKYQTDGTKSLMEHASSIDILAPQMYIVDKNLNATGTISLEIQTIARTNNIKVMPLIYNQNFDQKVIHNLLVSSSSQDRIIDYLVQEAKSYNYIGWQFDFENISYTDKDLYSAFVEKTAGILHKHGLILSVAVVPRVNDDINTDDYKNWSGVYDYARLATSSDFLSVMTYGDPYSVGPVASLPYVKNVLKYLDGKVSSDKISLGIPLYYWKWNIKTKKNLNVIGSYNSLQTIRNTNSVVEGFNNTYQVPYLMYNKGKNSYIIWYENKISIQSKLNIIQSNNLRGFSSWVLGIESSDIWQVKYSTSSIKTSTTSNNMIEKKFKLLTVTNDLSFKQVFEIAKYVEKITNVRPAFLLGILQEEFSLEHSDMCYLTSLTTGEGVRIIDNKIMKNTLHPTRDLPAFIKITQVLGKDPLKTAITCPMSFGWGGAMGPADFIPSTWSLYKNKVQKITGKPADPWDIQDALLAEGLFLSDTGANLQTEKSEWDSALIYFSGSKKTIHTFYAQGAKDKTREIQEEIDSLR